MESKSAPSGESSDTLKVLPVILQKDLHSLIGTVKKMQLVTTYQEVLEGLKIYIWEKKLYDPQDPVKVCCKNDKLGSVLGTEEFRVYDLKTFLRKLVFPVSKITRDSAEATPQSVSDSSTKRKLAESGESDQKKICALDTLSQPSSPMILHVPPSPLKCDSSDSADSVQGYETTYAKDTSDDLRSVEQDEQTTSGEISSVGQNPIYFSPEEEILAIEETYDLEYEVETDSSDYDIDSSDSDSEIEIATQVAMDAAILRFVCRTDSDIEFFADDSSDEDAELSESDNWECNSCSFLNRPTTRYCSKCWQERLGWLPEEHQRAQVSQPKKKRKQKKSRHIASNVKDICEKEEASSSKSSQDSQRSTEVEVSADSQENSPLSSEMCSSNISESVQKLCIICCSKPANASIIHGKYAHQISCYKCARKLQKQKKRCPICRRTIDRVVYQISN